MIFEKHPRCFKHAGHTTQHKNNQTYCILLRNKSSASGMSCMEVSCRTSVFRWALWMSGEKMYVWNLDPQKRNTALSQVIGWKPVLFNLSDPLCSPSPEWYWQSQLQFPSPNCSIQPPSAPTTNRSPVPMARSPPPRVDLPSPDVAFRCRAEREKPSTLRRKAGN